MRNTLRTLAALLVCAAHAHAAVIKGPVLPEAPPLLPRAEVLAPGLPAGIAHAQPLPAVQPALAAAQTLTAAVETPAAERPAALAAPFDGARSLKPVEGLFGPSSMVWRINGHHLGRFGALAALATQASHPLVAESAKVTRQLLQDPHRRILKTSVLLERVMFAERDKALEAVRLVNKRHAEIHGTLEEAVGVYPAGTPFSARDPELLKWVLATVYFYTLHSYERYVEKLTPDEKERYYGEIHYLGRLLAIPARALPSDHAGFEAYLHSMLNGDRLAVGSAAKELSAGFQKLPVTFAPLAALLKLPVDALKRLVVGTLPRTIRELHGLPWTLADRLFFPWEKRFVRLAVRATPTALLRTTAHTRALLRVKAAEYGLR